jgi:hypothetical protein
LGSFWIGGGDFIVVTAPEQLISNKANPIKVQFPAGTLKPSHLGLARKVVQTLFLPQASEVGVEDVKRRERDEPAIRDAA